MIVSQNVHSLLTHRDGKCGIITTKKKFHDCYEVNAVDPVDARNIAVQRLIEETGDGAERIRDNRSTKGRLTKQADTPRKRG